MYVFFSDLVKDAGDTEEVVDGEFLLLCYLSFLVKMHSFAVRTCFVYPSCYTSSFLPEPISFMT